MLLTLLWYTFNTASFHCTAKDNTRFPTINHEVRFRESFGDDFLGIYILYGQNWVVKFLVFLPNIQYFWRMKTLKMIENTWNCVIFRVFILIFYEPILKTIILCASKWRRTKYFENAAVSWNETALQLMGWNQIHAHIFSVHWW